MALKNIFAGQDISDLVPSSTKATVMQDENYPDLSEHNNWMSKCLTPAIYNKLKDRQTTNQYTIDKCIQTGREQCCIANRGRLLYKAIRLFSHWSDNIAIVYFPDDWGRPDGRTPQEIRPSISTDLSGEGRESRHHDEGRNIGALHPSLISGPDLGGWPDCWVPIPRKGSGSTTTILV